MNSVNLIGISAKISHGKDTVADIIRQLTFTHHTWQIKKFAGKLKQIVSLLTGITVSDLEKEEIKNSELPKQWNRLGNHLPMTVREMLQRVGTDAMRDHLHPNVWVNSLFSDYDEFCKWIVTDVRFPNEVEAVKSNNGIVIRIERPSIVSTSKHPSETALDSYDKWDYKIINDGSLSDLKEKVKIMLNHFEIPINETK